MTEHNRTQQNTTEHNGTQQNTTSKLHCVTSTSHYTTLRMCIHLYVARTQSTILQMSTGQLERYSTCCRPLVIKAGSKGMVRCANLRGHTCKSTWLPYRRDTLDGALCGSKWIGRHFLWRAVLNLRFFASHFWNTSLGHLKQKGCNRLHGPPLDLAPRTDRYSMIFHHG